jgi:hypothetical protein
MLKTLKLSVVIVALLFAAPAAHATGRIIVAHDEWPLSDWGFHYAPSARQFALNVASYFTGGRHGRFLVYSPSWGLTGDRLAATMREAGHEWTIVDPASEVPVDLHAYTAVFVGQAPVDNAVLTEYVLDGGNVYVMGGTGYGIADSRHWNAFLNAFGLHLETEYNGITGVIPVTATHELFADVSSLLHVAGNDIRTTGLVPGAHIIQAVGSHAIFAVYSDGSLLLPMTIKTSLCGDAVYIRKRSKGQISVNFIGAGVPGDAIEPQSVRVLGLAPLKFYVGDRLSLSSSNSSTPCTEHPDGVLDLQVKFDLQKVAQKLWSILGNTVADGDVVTLTATGRLKPAFGGAMIRGEADVTIRTR